MSTVSDRKRRVRLKTLDNIADFLNGSNQFGWLEESRNSSDHCFRPILQIRPIAFSSAIFFYLFGIFVISQTCASLSVDNMPTRFNALLKVHKAKLDEFDAYANHFLLPQDFDLADQTPESLVVKPTPDQVESVQNEELFEGDILGFAPENAALLNFLDDSFQHQRQFNDFIKAGDFSSIFNRPYHSSLNTRTYPDKLWSKGRVPYILEEGMTDAQRAAIAQAFDEYKTKTCIRFVPRENDDNDFIYIRRNIAYGCSSYVGRAGGNQTVSLEIGKCFSKGIIAHELMHAIGFFHEHSRTDRDQFVDIDDHNIRPGMMRNFEKYPHKIIDTLEMPYDYESVMHYHKLAFSKNGKPTISPKNEKAEIGQRYKLSKIDAMKVNKLYKCANSSPKESTTPILKPSSNKNIEEVDTESTTYVPEANTKFSISNILTPSISFPREIYHIIKGALMKKTATTTSVPKTEMKKSTSEYFWTHSPPLHGLITLSIITKKNTKNPIYTTPAPVENVELTTTDPQSYKITVENTCTNMNAHCEMWERLGHCEHSPKYMGHYCRKSCKLCNEPFQTSQAKMTIQENRRPDQMFNKNASFFSKKNGRFQRACIDRNLFCGYWAHIGECKSDSKFMKIFCKRSCGNC